MSMQSEAVTSRLRKLSREELASIVHGLLTSSINCIDGGDDVESSNEARRLVITAQTVLTIDREGQTFTDEEVQCLWKEFVERRLAARVGDYHARQTDSTLNALLQMTRIVDAVVGR